MTRQIFVKNLLRGLGFEIIHYQTKKGKSTVEVLFSGEKDIIKVYTDTRVKGLKRVIFKSSQENGPLNRMVKTSNLIQAWLRTRGLEDYLTYPGKKVQNISIVGHKYPWEEFLNVPLGKLELEAMEMNPRYKYFNVYDHPLYEGEEEPVG